MSSHDLTPEQLGFFDTFCFLALPGALADSVAEITAAFEEIWATRGGGHNGKALALGRLAPGVALCKDRALP